MTSNVTTPESHAVGHYEEPSDNIHNHKTPEKEESFVDDCETDNDVGSSYTNWKD